MTQSPSRRAVLGALGAAAAVAALPGTASATGGGWHGRRVPRESISIQLYTLRGIIGDNPAPVLEALADIGYRKVELAGTYGRTAEEFAKLLRRYRISATSTHVGIDGDLNKVVADAKALRNKYVVVPYLVSDQLSYWQDAADQMNAEAAIARRYGLRYGYHNHAHEFTTDLGRGVTPWEVLTERLDPRLVHLEVDLYWAYTGGVNTGAADPDQFAIDVIREAPQKVRQFHVKDRDAATGDMCDLGTGVVDFPRIFRSHEVEEYIVENDTPDVTPLTTAAVGHLYLDHVEY